MNVGWEAWKGDETKMKRRESESAVARGEWGDKADNVGTNEQEDQINGSSSLLADQQLINH